MTPSKEYRTTIPIIEQPTDLSIRHIPLTHGMIAIVDLTDYDNLILFKWQAVLKPKGFYARRAIVIDGRKRCHVWGTTAQ